MHSKIIIIQKDQHQVYKGFVSLKESMEMVEECKFREEEKLNYSIEN